MSNAVTLDGDQVLATAVKYLIEGDEWDAAQLLMYCTIENIVIVEEDNFRETTYGVDIYIRGPRMAVDKMNDGYDSIGQQIDQAIKNALPFRHWVASTHVRTSLHVPDQHWREDLQELIKGKGVTNQASGTTTSRLWQGFMFRSATEIRIAEALDRAGVLFFPLPKARVAPSEGRRKNVEPDFVICDEGRWGILEVDGEPFHPRERSAIEHERDRIFKRHGVVFVERFDANRCYNDPDKVVEEFRLLMVKAYRRP